MFAAAFSLWALLVARAARHPRSVGFAASERGVALLALVRPGNAVLLAFVAFPFVIAGARRERVRWAAGGGPRRRRSRSPPGRCTTGSASTRGRSRAAATRSSPSTGRSSPTTSSRRRTATRPGELAAAMQRDLLTREPYRSYGVTLDELFEQGSFRVHEDLYLLSDRCSAGTTTTRSCGDAGIEGVRAHPGTYASGVLGTVWEQLSKAFFRELPERSGRSSVAGSVEVRAASAFPRPRRASRYRAARSSGSLVPISESVRCGSSPTRWHFEFDEPGIDHGSRRSSARRRAVRRAARPSRERDSRPCARISSPAGTRGRGCGSCRCSSRSPCAVRGARRHSSR